MANPTKAPTLISVADIIVRVGEPISIGETGHGVRRLAPILGGSVTGRFSDDNLSADADFQLLGNDGVSELDPRYVIQTSTEALVYIVNQGIRCGPDSVMESR